MSLRTGWILIVLAFWLGKAYGQQENLPGGERILSFKSLIFVDSSGILTVEENILVTALNININRGIFRALPMERNINNNTIEVSYRIISVKKNGIDEPYHIQNEDGYKVIYIGDEDVFLNPGVYLYTITYVTERQIGFFDQFDELNWNVTGNQWAFPIDTAMAKVILPESARILQSSCYTGSYGSTSRDCSAEQNYSNSMTWSAFNLGEKQGLTVAVGFPKDIIPKPVIPENMKPMALMKWFLLVGFILFVIMAWLWYRHGVDLPSPAVYPQFDAPEDLSPAAIGYLENGRYKNKLIAATLINLAVKKVIKIEEVSKSGLLSRKKYLITRLDNNGVVLSSEESAVLNILVRNPGETLELDGTYDSTVQSAIQSFQSTIKNQYKSIIKEGSNRRYVFFIFLFVCVAYLPVLGSIHDAYFYAGEFDNGAVLFFTYIILYLIAHFSGYRTSRWIWLLPGLLTVVLFYFIMTTRHSINSYWLLIFFYGMVMTGISFFSYAIRQPGKRFLELKSLIDGFKMYLGAAENQLIKFHNPPKMTPEVFEKYLPFALVLGVDDIWGKKFENMLKEQSMEYHNQWYVGPNSFSNNFANSFSQSLSSTMASASTQPSSSSSGSGGGGFSGGGGGGGGGGGW